MNIRLSAVIGQELFHYSFPDLLKGPGKSGRPPLFFTSGARGSSGKRPCRPVVVLISLIILGSCTRSSDDIPLVPPPTPPLSRNFLGYGVVTASYTRVLGEPVREAESLGYLRRGSLVRVLERRQVDRRGTFESWVLVEGTYRGWLAEDMVRIYDSEVQAKTASESMPR